MVALVYLLRRTFSRLCKRRHELVNLGGLHKHTEGFSQVLGTFHRQDDLGAGVLTASYALYTIDRSVITRIGTDALIATSPVLFGVFRSYLVHQKKRGGSPTEVVLKDRSIQAIVALMWWSA